MLKSCDHALYFDDGYSECPECGANLGNPKFTPGWVAEQFGTSIDFRIVAQLMKREWEKECKVADLEIELDLARKQIRRLKRQISKFKNPSRRVLVGRKIML